MMDTMDLAQQQVAENLAHHLAVAISRPQRSSAFFCEDCEGVIPEARRRAVMGVVTCVSCQATREAYAR
ncbi:hypothetical protein C1N62_17930 (plasmid) [Nissabacter sp. SGAir0207]|nr:TraR/DksA C4-type zinc finger protein [Nissabacter sp. SGAir0207]QCR38021.1 hypothetical protein C1N62_17930 [Nissabacter sp. SGAir0207]